MARLTNERNFAPVIEGAKKWIEDCLIKGNSIFSESLLWRPEQIAEVHAAFVEHPDLGEENFITKLKGQMKGASASAQQLMAEMMWALLLFPSNVTDETKRQHVEAIWSLSGKPFPGNSPLLKQEVLRGIGSGGPGFNNHRWREMVFLIELTRSLKQKNTDERQRILSNYDAFMDWNGSAERPPAIPAHATVLCISRACRANVFKRPPKSVFDSKTYRPMVEAFCNGDLHSCISRQGLYQRVIMLLTLHIACANTTE